MKILISQDVQNTNTLEFNIYIINEKTLQLYFTQIQTSIDNILYCGTIMRSQ